MADDSGWGAAAGQGVQMGMGLLGEYLSGRSKDEQQRILRRALDEFGSISPPALERIIAEEQGPSAFEDVRADPEARAAQYAALDSLKGIADSGGHTLADDANLARARANAAGVASSGRNRIADEMAARGQLNSGATLAMQLAGNEGAANRASQESMQAAADQQRRALDAILQRGKLGGEMRGQQYNEDARRAEARDMLARTNAAARQRAQYYNAGLGQQRYDNQLNRARGMTGQLGNLASFQGQQADDQRELYAGLGASAARGGEQWDRKEELDAYGNPKRRSY